MGEVRLMVVMMPSLAYETSGGRWACAAGTTGSECAVKRYSVDASHITRPYFVVVKRLGKIKTMPINTPAIR